VHPTARKWLPESHGLCPFVLVMREDEVLTATVKVKSLAQEG
jgi:hypothetical protein